MATTHLPAAPHPSYPTSYPGRQSTPNPSFLYEIPHSKNRATPCVRRLILALILLFAMMTAISMIAWLMRQPQVPVFRVDSLSVSNFSLTNSQLTADFGINFTVGNPNRKIDLQLGDFKIYVLHNRKELLEERWNQTVWLKKMSQTGVSIELGTNSTKKYPLKGKTAIDMYREYNKRVVNFKVKMEVWAKFEAGYWLSKQKFVKVVCDNLKVGFFKSNVTAGTNMSGRTNCSAHLE